MGRPIRHAGALGENRVEPMIFTKSAIAGAFLIDMECSRMSEVSSRAATVPDEFAAQGLARRLGQCSLSYQRPRGHFAGTALSGGASRRAQAGALHGRCRSSTSSWISAALPPLPALARDRAFGTQSARAVRSAGIRPRILDLERCRRRCYYMISVPHAPEHARGVRWSDPAFGIEWPSDPSVISERDAAYPLLDIRG